VLVGDDEQPMTAVFNSTTDYSYIVLDDCNCSDLDTYETGLSLVEYRANDVTDGDFKYYPMTEKVNDGSFISSNEMRGLYVTQNN